MKNKTFLIVLTALIAIGGVFVIYSFTSSPASAYLSKEEAEEKISSQFSGEIVELELEDDNNQKVYEVEIKGTDRDYELKIDAETGEILKLDERTSTKADNQDITTTDDDADDQDTTDQDDREKGKEQASQSSRNTLISEDEAKSIALDQYQGKITEFELDEDDGRYEYEIEIRTDNREIDLEIDAYTGSIISISKDDLDDGDRDD